METLEQIKKALANSEFYLVYMPTTDFDVIAEGVETEV